MNKDKLKLFLMKYGGFVIDAADDYVGQFPNSAYSLAETIKNNLLDDKSLSADFIKKMNDEFQEIYEPLKTN